MPPKLQFRASPFVTLFRSMILRMCGQSSSSSAKESRARLWLFGRRAHGSALACWSSGSTSSAAKPRGDEVARSPSVRGQPRGTACTKRGRRAQGCLASEADVRALWRKRDVVRPAACFDSPTPVSSGGRPGPVESGFGS